MVVPRPGTDSAAMEWPRFRQIRRQRYSPIPLAFWSLRPLQPVKPFSKIRGISSAEHCDAGAGAVKGETLGSVDKTAADGAEAEKLTDEAHDDKHDGVAESLEDAVERGGTDGVLCGESLGATDDDAVNNIYG